MENSSNGREDAVRHERMLSLKRSRAGHLGYLNRLYKDVELLMRNAENFHEACEKKKEDYAKTISWIRARTSFALLRSALICLRGSRAKRKAFCDFKNVDIDIEIQEGAIM